VTLAYDVIEEARRRGSRLVVGAPQRWLSTRGHLDPVVQREAPAEVLDVLERLHTSLGGDLAALARRPIRHEATDLATASGQLIELDGVEHFTSARWDTLRDYPAMYPFGFSIDYYRALIETWRAKANAVFTRQWSPDFDFSGGRRAHRAYFDAVKDLLTPTFTGQQLIRVPVVDRDPARAARQIAILARPA
jgi:hypothetical protein